jgi:hypothetical protein
MEGVFEFEYQVLDADVVLSIEIGDQQLGSSVVRLDGKVVGGPGEVTDLALGCGAQLAGRDLAVKTLVADVNENTNRTSVTYVLSGGVPHEPFIVRQQVPNNGDSATYRTTFRLLPPAAGAGA